jgi:hypothetical protein
MLALEIIFQSLLQKFTELSNQLVKKIFKSPHDEGLISKMYDLSQRSAAYPTKLKFAKGKLAMGIAAVATALAFVAHGIYKAGKINGEAK